MLLISQEEQDGTELENSKSKELTPAEATTTKQKKRPLLAEDSSSKIKKKRQSYKEHVASDLKKYMGVLENSKNPTEKLILKNLHEKEAMLKKAEERFPEEKENVVQLEKPEPSAAAEQPSKVFRHPLASIQPALVLQDQRSVLESEEAANSVTLKSSNIYPKEHLDIILSFPRRNQPLCKLTTSDTIPAISNKILRAHIHISKDPELCCQLINMTRAEYKARTGDTFMTERKTYSVGDRREDSLEDLVGGVRSDTWIGKLAGMWQKLARFEANDQDFRYQHSRNKYYLLFSSGPSTP